jgi:rhodanese-related sulfurtransferase
MTINDLLSAARQRLDRVHPVDALDAVLHGAVLVDIRSEFQRQADGVIAGALFYPRNVLEWRIDPASGYSDPSLGCDLDKQLIVFCDEGYQSSLVAATLRDLGFRHATDLIGGFQAWCAAGLPVQRSPEQVATDRASSSAASISRGSSDDPEQRTAASLRRAGSARPLGDDPGERLGAT